MIAIPQDPFILNDTVRRNIDPSQSIPDEKIIDAFTKVHIWSIIESRGGLDQDMKSQPLSQGQQQLFCLARALLRESKILILDEATSNVDSETDKRMQEVIRKEFRDHTVITVAHRMETILDSDVVAVLDKGVLIEFGSPKELLNRPSLFKDLNGR
jgi:ATP-binding cassette, subfamily C (CFTR/MRP), member 1